MFEYMKHSLNAVVIGIALILSGAPAGAGIRLPSVLGDHMVLQRDAEVALWGGADPGAAVKVVTPLQSVETVANAEGRWETRLAPMPASFEPMSVTITAGTETRTLDDVLVGEVWLCSGQSNMQWPLRAAKDADIEILSADYPHIRLYQVDHQTAQQPRLTANGTWQPASAGSVPGFSAVGYFFGRDLHRVLGCPVGLIKSSWGGTPAEAWTRAERLAEDEATAVLLTEWEEKLAVYPELAKAWAAEVKEWEARQGGGASVPAVHHDPGIAPPAVGFSAARFDDRGWQEVTLPSTWQVQTGRNRDGAMWYRRSVDIPADWVGQSLTVHLGAIDDFDTTFVNGVKVGGETHPDAYQVLRRYVIPAEAVTGDQLILAIRVFDRMGTGGFTGRPGDLRLELAAGGAEPIPLAGTWRTQVELELPAAGGEGGGGRPPPPAGPDSPHRPGSLANGMLGPVVPFTLRGAIWYQGESNAARPEQYRVLLPMMIKDWRDRWGQGDFPFGIVQLASFRAVHEEPGDDAWAHLRDAQLHTALTVPNAGLAVATDLGEADNIHPLNKLDVGRRLARWALADVYDQDILVSGPLYRGHRIDGDRVLCTFDHVGGGLKVLHGGAPQGFVVAGADRVWHLAEAELVGNDVVAVRSDAVPEPVAVRYAWAENPANANLINAARLPAVAFRTDDWPRAR